MVLAFELHFFTAEEWTWWFSGFPLGVRMFFSPVLKEEEEIYFMLSLPEAYCNINLLIV